MTPEQELAQLEDYLAKNLFSWFRPDARVEAAGKVTLFADKVSLVADGAVAPNARSVDPAHALAQASSGSQVAGVVADAAWNNRETATFTAGPYYTSTIGAANWKFFYTGSGASHWLAFSATGVSNIVNVTNTGSTPGSSLTIVVPGSPGTFTNAVYNDAGVAYNTGAVGSYVTGSPTYHSTECASGAGGVVNRQKTTTIATGTLSSPTVNTGAQTLTLGRQALGGGAPFAGKFADLMIANKVDAILRAAVERYLVLRYPVLA